MHLPFCFFGGAGESFPPGGTALSADSAGPPPLSPSPGRRTRLSSSLRRGSVPLRQPSSRPVAAAAGSRPRRLRQMTRSNPAPPPAVRTARIR